MIDRLIKRLIKTFMPSPATLAKMAAKQIQAAINDCQKGQTIAKCASIAAYATEIQKFVSDTLIDGKISDEEAKQVEDKLVPLFEKVIELACK